MHTRCSGLQLKMHTRNTDAVRLSSRHLSQSHPSPLAAHAAALSEHEA